LTPTTKITYGLVDGILIGGVSFNKLEIIFFSIKLNSSEFKYFSFFTLVSNSSIILIVVLIPISEEINNSSI
jgi:hypothetical protein